jgi:hypothetical protein
LSTRFCSSAAAAALRGCPQPSGAADVKQAAQMFRYVRHDDVGCYLQAGWEIAADLADCYHGEFGMLMMRPFDGPEDLKKQ